MTGEDVPPQRKPADGKHVGGRPTPAGGSRSWQGLDQASRATADILAGPVIWGGIGWLVDRWLGTDPWLMSIGIMGGFAGGLYLVWLRAKQPVERVRGQGPGRNDSDTEA